jgi:type I restriction enzyme S subunit
MAEGATQPGVNSSKLAALTVPVPPMTRQREFERAYDGVAALRSVNQNALRESTVLFEGLAHRAFRGDDSIFPR